MDCMSNDAIREVTVKKSARVGYTKMLLAAIGYFAEHKRRNQAVWQPTDEDAEDFVKTDVDTMLRDVDVMQRVMPSQRQRDSANTLRFKRFRGSVLHIRGGKSAKNYRRLTVDIAYLDELDGFDSDIQKEGSPVKLSLKRLEGATFPKHIRGSTPRTKHDSLIEACERDAERRFLFHTPCPECGEEHVVKWGGKDKPFGMKWSWGEPDRVRQLCPHCGTLYTQQDYLRVWHMGRWIDSDGIWIDPEGHFRTAEGARIAAPHSVAFHVWTAQSKQATWSQLATDFEEAVDKAKAGDKNDLKTFINTTLGETYEEEVQQADFNVLKQRAEDYPLGICPRGVLLLTAGVDVQDRRFEISVWGWGRGEESWLVDHQVLEANPADQADWDRLDAYLKTRFPHASGQTLPIEAVGVDTGGHFTHEVYNFCRVRSVRRILAVKGADKPGQPVKGRASLQDVNYRGAILKAGVRLYFVGTDTAKDTIFGRFDILRHGPACIHLCKHLPDEWFEQLTAEARVPQKVAGGREVFRWVKRRPRNEALDCYVYALFAAHVMDLPRYTDAMWARIEERVNPMQGALLRQAIEPVETPAQAASEAHETPENRPVAALIAAKPARMKAKPQQNFVTGWRRG